MEVKRKPSQAESVLEYLREHGSITARDIYEKLCINGATARISDLRKLGFNIRSEYETAPSGAKYKRYYLEEI